MSLGRGGNGSLVSCARHKMPARRQACGREGRIPNEKVFEMLADLKPQTLSARLLVQSFKLARGTIMKRFDKRLATVARDMEERAAKMA